MSTRNATRGDKTYYVALTPDVPKGANAMANGATWGHAFVAVDDDEFKDEMESPSSSSSPSEGEPPFSTRSIRELKWRHRWIEAINRGGWIDIVKQWGSKNSGLLLISLSQLFFAFMNVTVKILNSLDEPVGPLELIWFRMSITYTCCMAYMLCRKVPDPWLGPKGVRLLLILRGFFGFFGLFGVYFSLQYLPLSDATVLTFLAPLFTSFVCAILLKETFTMKQGVAGFLSLLGVVLIARPTFLFSSFNHSVPAEVSRRVTADKVTAAQRLNAVIVALIGVLGATGAYTSLRAIGHRAHAMHALVSFCVQCLVVSAIGMIIQQEPFVIPARWDFFLLLISIGILGFISQTLMTIGLQRETAGRGMTAIYVQIIYATVLERIVFHTTPPLLSVIGTIIILSCAIYIAMVKQDAAGLPKAENGSIRLENRGESSIEEGLLEHEGQIKDQHGPDEC